MPIIGVIASSLRAAADTGAMFPLQVITVGPTAVSDVTFTNIPNTYTHLQIRGIMRTSLGSDLGGFAIRLNGDAGTNYAGHILWGDGATAYAAAQTSTNSPAAMVTAGANATSGIFASVVLDILDYANTNKNKTIRSLSGTDLNGAGQIRFGSVLWQNTSAVTSVRLYDFNGANLVQYSQFALYGVKSA